MQRSSNSKSVLTSRKKTLGPLLAGAILVGGSTFAHSTDLPLSNNSANEFNDTSSTINFKDKNFEDALRQELNIIDREITQDDMSERLFLFLNAQGIKDLTGLEHAVNLEELFLEENHIEDIQPLTQLKQLKFIRLRDNDITDISPLKELSKLEEVDLSLNLIDLDDSATAQTYTTLKDRGISIDIEDQRIPIQIPDKNFENALRRELKITDRKITTYDMSQLSSIWSFSQEIKDLTGLEYAINIEELFLEDNHIENLQPLAKLKQLKIIDLRNNNISDISSLKELPRIENINLSQNLIDLDE